MKPKVHTTDDEINDDLLSTFLEKSLATQEEVDFKMKLAAKIIKAVRAKGWSNSKFAKEMGLNSLSIVTKWFSGTQNFEVITLRKIEKVLNIRLINLETAYDTSKVETV